MSLYFVRAADLHICICTLYTVGTIHFGVLAWEY